MAAPDPGSFDQSTARASPASARDMACRAIAAQARRFPDLLASAPDTDALDARDAALAHAIYDAVIRRWLTLAAILNSRLRAPLDTLEPKLQAVLLSGAAQLLFLSRLPDHAVINESVSWAKRAIRPGAGAMVNAVLRRIATLRSPDEPRPSWTARRDELPLSDGSALVLTEPVMPEDPLALLAAATSHPADLLQNWASSFGPAKAREFALHSLVTPPTIINAQDAAAAQLSADLTPHAARGHWVFKGDRAGLVSLLADHRDLWVQDPAAAAAINGLEGLRPRVILDICAGQGTKTRQLAARFPDAAIVATDTDSARLKTLKQAMSGVANVTVTTLGGLRERWGGNADLILLDVPCSNTGVLARRAEARYRAVGSLERLAATQRQIIADSIPLLAPRASILYSTCSLEPQENQAQGAWANRWHRYRVRNANTLLPAGLPGSRPEGYSDGSFSCLMETG